MTAMDEALKSLTKRQLEALQAQIERELRSCVMCGTEGASPFVVRASGDLRGTSASLVLCRPCFEKHRLPESRAGVTA